MSISIKDRFWGKEKDHHAAKQLGVSEDYTIFLMSIDADYVDGSISEILYDIDDDDLTEVNNYIEAVQNIIRKVKLPTGFMLVGMTPITSEGEDVYGIVDFSALGAV